MQAGVLLFAAGAALAALRNNWMLVAAVCGVVAVAAGAVLSVSRSRLGQLAAGIGAEDRSAKALARSGAAIVLHGARVGPGDVDHVVAGPVLLAVETKYGRGEVHLRDGTVTVGGRVLRGDPLGQSRRNAALVGERLGAPCTAVLAISEGQFRPFVHDGVLLCPAAQLASVVASAPRVLAVTAADAGRIASRLGLAAGS